MLGALGFLCLVFALSICVATHVLTAPAPATIGSPPDSLGLVERVEFPSESGSLLRGWWLPATRRNATVILMHGIRANRTIMIERARVLHEWGYAVLLFDLQAHGESPGTRISFGHREALDATSAVTFAKTRMPQARLGLIGQSLGAAAILLARWPLPVDAVVIESVYPNIDAALANRLKRYLGDGVGSVFGSILSPALRILLPVTIDVHPDNLRPIDRISSVTAPILVLSGTEDRNTTIEETRALFNRARDPKSYREIEGAAHVDLERFDPGRYWQVVLPFLDVNLK